MARFSIFVSISADFNRSKVLLNLGKVKRRSLLLRSSDVEERQDNTLSFRIAQAGTLSLSKLVVILMISNKFSLSEEDNVPDSGIDCKDN